MEWGAVWIREFKDGISHIIVDKGLQYRDVLSFLKIQSLPVSLLAPMKTVIAELYRRMLFSSTKFIRPSVYLSDI